MIWLLRTEKKRKMRRLEFSMQMLPLILSNSQSKESIKRFDGYNKSRRKGVAPRRRR